MQSYIVRLTSIVVFWTGRARLWLTVSSYQSNPPIVAEIKERARFVYVQFLQQVISIKLYSLLHVFEASLQVGLLVLVHVILLVLVVQLNETLQSIYWAIVLEYHWFFILFLNRFSLNQPASNSDPRKREESSSSILPSHVSDSHSIFPISILHI